MNRDTTTKEFSLKSVRGPDMGKILDMAKVVSRVVGFEVKYDLQRHTVTGAANVIPDAGVPYRAKILWGSIAEDRAQIAFTISREVALFVDIVESSAKAPDIEVLLLTFYRSWLPAVFREETDQHLIYQRVAKGARRKWWYRPIKKDWEESAAV